MTTRTKKQKLMLKRALKLLDAYAPVSGKLVETLGEMLDGELNDWDAVYDNIHCVVEAVFVADFVRAEVLNRLRRLAGRAR